MVLATSGRREWGSLAQVLLAGNENHCPVVFVTSSLHGTEHHIFFKKPTELFSAQSSIQSEDLGENKKGEASGT